MKPHTWRGRWATLLATAVALAGCRSDPAADRRSPLAAPGSAAEPALLPTAGTVVVVGDSVTWGDHYLRYIEIVARSQPRWRDVVFVNRGVRGATVRTTLQRIERDVVALHPRQVIVMLGLNDGGYRPPSRGRREEYIAGMTRLIRKIRHGTDASILLSTTTAMALERYDDRIYNRALAQMARALVALGRRQGVPVADLFSFFHERLTDASERPGAPRLMRDDRHPSPAAHLLIAAFLLAHLAPAVAGPPPVRTLRWPTGSDRAELSRAQRAIVALPAELRSAAALLPRHMRFDRHVVRVRGLPGPARLRAGSWVSGPFGARRWARGVDLGQIDGSPWSRRTRRLDRLLARRWAWEHYLWDPRGSGPQAYATIAGGPPPAGVSPDKARGALRRLRSRIRALLSADVRPVVVELASAPDSRPDQR